MNFCDTTLEGLISYAGFVAGERDGGWEVGEAAVEEALAEGVGPGVGVAEEGDEDVAVAEFGLAAGAAADSFAVVVVVGGVGALGARRIGEVLDVVLSDAVGEVLDGGGEGMVDGREWVAAVAVFHGGVGEGKGGSVGGEDPDSFVGWVEVVVAFDVAVWIFWGIVLGSGGIGGE